MGANARVDGEKDGVNDGDDTKFRVKAMEKTRVKIREVK